MGSLKDGGVQPVCTADKENEVLMTAVCAGLDKLSKPRRGQLFAVFVERYEVIVF